MPYFAFTCDAYNIFDYDGKKDARTMYLSRWVELYLLDDIY